MHPRYISTSFVSFPFLFSLFSILPPLFLSYLPSQRQLSRDTSRVARTHTHGPGADSPSGIPVERTNAHTQGWERRRHIHAGCVSKVLSLQITLSRPACWIASNFNWIRTRAKKFSTTIIPRRKFRIDSGEKKNSTLLLLPVTPWPIRETMAEKRVYPRATVGFRVIPTQHTPKYPRALSSCIMHTEPAAAEATSPIYRGAWLLSTAGREGERSQAFALSLSLSLRPKRYFIFRSRLNSTTLTFPLSLLPVTPPNSLSLLLFSRGRILAACMTARARGRIVCFRDGIGREWEGRMQIHRVLSIKYSTEGDHVLSPTTSIRLFIATRILAMKKHWLILSLSLFLFRLLDRCSPSKFLRGKRSEEGEKKEKKERKGRGKEEGRGRGCCFANG